MAFLINSGKTKACLLARWETFAKYKYREEKKGKRKEKKRRTCSLIYGRKVYLFFGLIKKSLRENSQSLFYKQLLNNERTFILKIDVTDNSKNFRLIFFPAKTSTWWQRIDSGICILQYFIFKPRFCLSVVKIQWHNGIKDPCISESLCIFYSIL